MTNYARTPTQLRKKAVLYWPDELAKKEKAASIMPRLLSTQDKFISILDVSDSSPEAWKHALAATNELPANLFLKHLMILSDVGGEPLQRIRTGFSDIFPEGFMAYSWKGKLYQYVFKAIPTAKRLTNSALFVDGRRLHSAHALEPLMEDVIMLLLHGAAATGGAIPDVVKDKCMIGSLMGDKTALEKFVKQRYIWVSRITRGATSNTLGQIAQDYVKDVLTTELPDWTITRNGTIPGMSQTAGKTDMTFDIVAHSLHDKWVGIEVCFQFTTNSVIERKSGQAEARINSLHSAGHTIAYVIDGAGNFERASALANICRHSDCNVAFSPEEISVLAKFIREQS